MAFTVIYMPPGLSAADRVAALEAGPAFLEAEAAYEAMLAQTGWRITSHLDVTDTFVQSMRRMIEAQQAHADQLAKLTSADAARESLTRMRQKLPAIERRLLLRGLFVARPV
jgi:hypothetical protein